MNNRNTSFFVTQIILLLLFGYPCLAQEQRYLQETTVEFDSQLLESLLLPSGLDLFDEDLHFRLYNGTTSSLEQILNSARDYLETIPLTNELLNGLSSEQPDDSALWNDKEIQRVVHWMYIFNTLSDWSKEQTNTTLMDWISFNDARLENYCTSKLIPLMETNEFEQSLGAPQNSCLKAILTKFPFMKYVGVREAYKKMIQSDNLATDLTADLTKNIYEAVFNDYRRGNGRVMNAMVGDRLVVMNQGLPIFGGRNCNSNGCEKSISDEIICLSSFDTNPEHSEQRNCTLSQEYIDLLTEWDINFVLGSRTKLQDTLIAKLLFPALHTDTASCAFERVQSLYFAGVSVLTRVMLNPLKVRHYFPFDEVNDHAEQVLTTWIENDPDLTSWNDPDDDPPFNGIDPSLDPINAQVGDWMEYLNDLYTPTGDSFSMTQIFQIISFLRARCYFDFIIPPDVV